MNITQRVKPVSGEKGYYLKDAAQLLGCTVQRIRQKIEKGVIPKELWNGKIWISEEALAILEQE